MTDADPRTVEAARSGDEAAFRELLEPHQRELHAHCYRMLGSVHDADDALQDATVRAWRGLARFEGRSSLRSWLYTIATNTCLTHIERRPKRALPVEYGPPTDPHTGPGDPLIETVWIEPYPDAALEVEQRESVELAFIAALQHLPATQRAVLILREVLGYTAKETAATLETTVASVNSALQRARATIEDRLPERSQQQTLKALGDEQLSELVSAYVDAWESGDVEAVVELLAEEATFAMPPLASWFGPRDQVRDFLRSYPMSGQWEWRAITTSANGQPAIAYYVDGIPFALNVLTIGDGRITDVVAFVVRVVDPDDILSWPDQPPDPGRVERTFERFGLPPTL
jgi:RNA polymerase sigma-70 factor (ECF subfamily)